MKILLLSNMYPSISQPYYGIFVKNYEEGMIKNNCIIEKIVIDNRGNNTFDKIIKYFIYILKTEYSIICCRYDIVYVHYINHSLLPLVLLKRMIKKPIIINAHGSDVLGDKRIDRIIQRFVLPVIKRADLVVVPSEYFKKVVINKYNFLKNKIYISPSGGIDNKIFKQMNISQRDNLFIMGCVSRIDKGKGWELLISSTIELLERGITGFKIVIIGGGSEQSKLVEKIDTYSLASYINYVGPKKRIELSKYYNMMDVFVFPTRLEESLGLVGLEAMACGIPVVGSNIGGLSGYIQSGINGELFEAGNTADLVEKIIKMMKLDQDKRKAYKENALKTAERYDSTLVASKLYREIVRVKKESALYRTNK